MLCVAMLAPMASMAMPVGAQGEDAFTSSSVDTQKDIGECSICEVVTDEWTDFNGNKYYFLIEDGNEENQMAVGWVETLNGSRYYFYEDEDGEVQMAVGLVKIDGAEYYFYEDGAREGQMAVGWIKTPNGSKYYFDKDEGTKGQMVVGWCVTEDGSKRYFTESEGPDKGVLKTGWFKDDNRWYYAKTAEDKGEGRVGEVVTGEWTDSEENKYYFVEEDGNGRKKGELFTGWHVNGGEWYYYSEDTDNNKNLGEMQKDWTYVMDNDAYNGETKLRRYYLDKEIGAMYKGWFNDESGARYFLSDRNRGKFREGERVVGWVEIDGNFYYFHEYGDREGQMVDIDGQTYCFSEDGMRIEVLEELERN